MNMNFLSAVATAVLLCGAGSAALAQNVATVNGKPVPQSRIEILKQQLTRSGRPVTPDMQGQLKDAVIGREIFLQEAQKQGLDTTEDFKNQNELSSQSLLINELFVTYLKANPVTDDDIKAEYDKFAANNSGKEYKARHILVEKEDQAKAIIAQVKKGGKFDEIAKKSSKDTGSAIKGGELDWAGAGNYVPEFSQAMVKLAKGKMTETPIKSEFGYHIIRVDDIRDAQLPKLDDVKPQIAQQLQQQKVMKYQDELRAKAKIE